MLLTLQTVTKSYKLNGSHFKNKIGYIGKFSKLVLFISYCNEMNYLRKLCDYFENRVSI